MKELPKFLYDMLVKQYDLKFINKIIEGYSKKRVTTLRVNTLKSDISEIKKTFEKNNINYHIVSWNNDAIILDNDGDIKKLDIYSEGKIYLQSLSSMMPVIILDPIENESILDMSAAPGSKTTQIASLTNNKSLITAVEKNKIRFDRLKYNIEKQGATHVTTLMEDARFLDDFYTFDKILLDAPCSGSGTIYLDNLNNNFNLDLINRCKKLQTNLLEKALKLLKVGGTMVYSTCSILKEENEDIVNAILKKGNVEIIPIEKEMFQDVDLLPTSIDGTICVMPSDLYEGFFIAKIRRIK